MLGREDRPHTRPATLRLLALLVGLLLAGLLTEGVFRVLLYVQDQVRCEGTCFKSERHARWGWALKPGFYHVETSEFEARGTVNELYLNDEPPYDASADADVTRILALGDSHTAAVGVSGADTWVSVLERRLNETRRSGRFACYNTAAPGYSLHQYLARLVDQAPALRPDYVVVGFSFATDLYDLLPPDRGGWIYGAEEARVYWELENGSLVEKYWEASQTAQTANRSVAYWFRRVLDHFATFRYVKRSPLALTIGTRLRPGGQSLWPNMEVVLEREPSEQHRYQWDLALLLLRKMDDEARRLGATLVVVGIPYLPQVYDEIWEGTFGNDPRYSPTAAPDRLAAFLRENGIGYVETRDALREAVRASGHWVHHRRDGHPTREGQAAIAEAVLGAGLLEARRPRAGDGVAAAP